MRVFISDDDSILLSITAHILSRKGLVVQYAQPPYKDSFFEDLDKFNPDVILLDIYLGDEIRAEDLAKEIRMNTHLKDTPIIAMSSSELLEDKMKIFSSGFVDYLNKPFTKEKLFETVSRHGRFNEMICLCRDVLKRNKEVRDD